MTESVEPDGEIQTEIDELRARNRELEQRQEASVGRKLARIGRSIASVALIVLGVLCLVLSPPVVWGRNLVLNTDRYVQTMEPLARDPGVQKAIVTAVDKQVSANLDLKALVAQTLPPRAQVLAAPLQSAANGLVDSLTTKFVQSDAFQKLWTTVNRVAHQQIDYILTGHQPDNAALQVNNGKVVLNLAPIVSQIKKRLVDAGLSVASKVPAVGATIEIAEVKGLEKARKATRLLDHTADWLPWIGLVLIGGGIATARRRRRALIVSAVSVGVGMVVIGIGLILARNAYLGSIDPAVLPRATASSIFDTLVRFLRLGIRLVLLVALIIALGAWVSGSTRSAKALRRGFVRAPRALGARLDMGPVGSFVLSYTTALRVAAIASMFIVLLLVDNPTVGTVIVLAIIAVVLLLLIEMLRSASAQGRTPVNQAQ